MISVKINKNFSGAELSRNLPKLLALALTKTAQEAQTDVIAGLPENFTIRGNWWKKTSKFGIKIKPAEKKDTNPTAHIGTDADWLELHEGGGTKQRRNLAALRKSAEGNTNDSFQRLVTGKGLIAIPTKNVRRTKRDIIRKTSKPTSLKNAFAIKSNRGNILIMNRPTKKAPPVVMYLLRKSAKIKNKSGVIEPAVKSISKNLGKNFNAAAHRIWKPSK